MVDEGQLQRQQDGAYKLQRLAYLAILGAMKITPTAAMEVLLGLPPLHVTVEVEAQAGI
jgi:hypothetical protein